jgi:hypothetical protein
LPVVLVEPSLAGDVTTTFGAIESTVNAVEAVVTPGGFALSVAVTLTVKFPSAPVANVFGLVQALSVTSGSVRLLELKSSHLTVSVWPASGSVALKFTGTLREVSEEPLVGVLIETTGLLFVPGHGEPAAGPKVTEFVSVALLPA